MYYLAIRNLSQEEMLTTIAQAEGVALLLPSASMPQLIDSINAITHGGIQQPSQTPQLQFTSPQQQQPQPQLEQALFLISQALSQSTTDPSANNLLALQNILPLLGNQVVQTQQPLQPPSQPQAYQVPFLQQQQPSTYPSYPPSLPQQLWQPSLIQQSQPLASPYLQQPLPPQPLQPTYPQSLQPVYPQSMSSLQSTYLTQFQSQPLQPNYPQLSQIMPSPSLQTLEPSLLSSEHTKTDTNN